MTKKMLDEEKIKEDDICKNNDDDEEKYLRDSFELGDDLNPNWYPKGIAAQKIERKKKN